MPSQVDINFRRLQLLRKRSALGNGLRTWDGPDSDRHGLNICLSNASMAVLLVGSSENYHGRGRAWYRLGTYSCKYQVFYIGC